MKKMYLKTIILISVLICCVGVTSAATLPTITSIDVTTAPNTGDVTINNLAGTGFWTTPNLSVMLILNDTYVGWSAWGTITGSTNTQIVCTFPITRAPSGKYDVWVGDGYDLLFNGTLPNGFTITALAPTLTSITPNNGEGIVPITNLAGTNFQNVMWVNLTHTGLENITATTNPLNPCHSATRSMKTQLPEETLPERDRQKSKTIQRIESSNADEMRYISYRPDKKQITDV